MNDKILKILLVAGIIVIFLLIILVIVIRDRLLTTSRTNRYIKLKVKDGIDIDGGTGGSSGLGDFCYDTSETLVCGAQPVHRKKIVLIDCNNGYRYEAYINGMLYVGRRNENNISNYLELPGYSTISKKQLSIINNNGYLYINDLGSSNRTIYNGTALMKQELLSSGDYLRLGGYDFIVEVM